MAELTVEQRLERLERYAQIICWRCSKPIRFEESKIISDPRYPEDEWILCLDCYDSYSDLAIQKKDECNIALREWLKEVRAKRIKGD